MFRHIPVLGNFNLNCFTWDLDLSPKLSTNFDFVLSNETKFLVVDSCLLFQFSFISYLQDLNWNVIHKGLQFSVKWLNEPTSWVYIGICSSVPVQWQPAVTCVIDHGLVLQYHWPWWHNSSLLTGDTGYTHTHNWTQFI